MMSNVLLKSGFNAVAHVGKEFVLVDAAGDEASLEFTERDVAGLGLPTKKADEHGSFVHWNSKNKFVNLVTGGRQTGTIVLDGAVAPLRDVTEGAAGSSCLDVISNSGIVRTYDTNANNCVVKRLALRDAVGGAVVANSDGIVVILVQKLIGMIGASYTLRFFGKDGLEVPGVSPVKVYGLPNRSSDEIVSIDARIRGVDDRSRIVVAIAVKAPATVVAVQLDARTYQRLACFNCVQPAGYDGDFPVDMLFAKSAHLFVRYNWTKTVSKVGVSMLRSDQARVEWILPTVVCDPAAPAGDAPEVTDVAGAVDPNVDYTFDTVCRDAPWLSGGVRNNGEIERRLHKCEGPLEDDDSEEDEEDGEWDDEDGSESEEA